MSKGRRFFCLLSAFLTTLFLCALCLLLTLLTTVHSSTFINDYIDDEYCHAAYTGLMDKWNDYGEPALIPEEVFSEALPETQLAAEIRLYSRTVWSGEESYQSQAEQVSRQLMDAFVSYADELGVDITEELQLALETLRDTCMKEYTSYARVPFLNSAGGLVRSTYKLTLIAIVVSAVLAAVLIFLSVRLHSYWFGGMRDTVYALFGAGLVLIPPSLWVLLARPLANLNVDPSYFRVLIVRLGDHCMWQLLLFAGVLVMIGIGLLVLAEIAERRMLYPPKRIPGHLVQPDDE